MAALSLISGKPCMFMNDSDRLHFIFEFEPQCTNIMIVSYVRESRVNCLHNNIYFICTKNIFQIIQEILSHIITIFFFIIIIII